MAGRSPEVMAVTASAHAAAGDFAKARRLAAQALAAYTASGDELGQAEVQSQIERYDSDLPYIVDSISIYVTE